MYKFKKSGVAALILAGLIIGFGPNPVFAKGIAWQSFSNGMARGKSENKKIKEKRSSATHAFLLQ